MSKPNVDKTEKKIVNIKTDEVELIDKIKPKVGKIEKKNINIKTKLVDKTMPTEVELVDKIKPKVNRKKKDDQVKQLTEQLDKKLTITPKPNQRRMVKKDIVYKEGYVIPKLALSEKDKNMLLSELTVVPQVDKDFLAPNVDLSFPVYREDDINYYVPKFWALKKFGQQFIQPVIVKNSQVDFTFNGVLRGTQPEVVEHIMKKLMETNGGLLQLHTGYGKTTIAIYIASILKLKTLVIVHKSFLMDQWYERIQQFSDASVGIVRQKKVDVDGRDIVLCMVQSLALIDYDPELFKDIDLVIFDEAHRASSKVFSRAQFKFNPKYTIALSATPTRTDGLTKVLHYFFGETIVKVERKCDGVVFVKSFDYESNNLLFMEKKKWFQGVVKPNTIQMLTNICIIDERNRFVSNIINELRKINGRKILVLSKRINHLKILKIMVDNMIKEDVKNGLLCEDEVTTSYYVGGLKDWQLKNSEEADIIFASFAMCCEGLDIGSLNTLVLATSIRDPVQCLGRIMRKQVTDGEINPLIIDICDKLSFFENWGKQRVNYYKTNKYIVDKIQVFNDNCVSMYDYMIKKKMIEAGTYDAELLREKYITHLYGKETYIYEKRVKFRNYPISMFNYKNDLSSILQINTENTDYSQQGSIINYNPETVY